MVACFFLIIWGHAAIVPGFRVGSVFVLKNEPASVYLTKVIPCSRRLAMLPVQIHAVAHRLAYLMRHESCVKGASISAVGRRKRNLAARMGTAPSGIDCGQDVPTWAVRHEATTGSEPLYVPKHSRRSFWEMPSVWSAATLPTSIAVASVADAWL